MLFVEAKNLKLSLMLINIGLDDLFLLKVGSHVFGIVASALIMIPQAIFPESYLFMTAFSVRNSNWQHLSNTYFIQSSLVSALCELLYLDLLSSLGNSDIIIPISEMRKWRFREDDLSEVIQ